MTGKQLFEISLDLLALRSQGAELPCDTDDLSARALSLINVALAENSALDCRIRKTEHTVKSIDSLADEIDCGNIVLFCVLPYALARLLVIGEDDSLAATMNGLYEEAKRNALKFGKAKAEPITEVYK